MENGLIDEIATYEETIEIMKKDCGLDGCEVEDFCPPASDDLYSLLGILAEEKGSGMSADADAIEELVAMNGTFRLSYLSNMRK